MVLKTIPHTPASCFHFLPKCFIIDALKKHVGLEQEKKPAREYTDLDGLFGAWSEEEFTAIQGGINTERKIDPELWQ